MINIDRIIAILAVLIALYALYRNNYANKNPILDVKTFSVNKYEMPNNCKPINKYQVRFKIKNIGETTIVGIGNSKNILDDNLTLSFNNVKEFNIKQAFHIFELDYSKKSSNLLELSFKQWMPYDFVEFICDVELEDESKLFNVYLTKHQIINGQINYSQGEIDDITFYTYDNKLLLKKDY